MPAVAAATIAVAFMPQVTSIKPDTADVAAHPAALPQLMKALSRPCSLVAINRDKQLSLLVFWPCR